MKYNKSYEDLVVWQKAVDLAEKIYANTNNFPKSEIYGITSQIRRSSVSIASNIAEGCARSSNKDFARFIFIALGSAAELKTQYIIAKRIGYVDDNFYKIINDFLIEIERMLHGLRKSLLKTETVN